MITPTNYGLDTKERRFTKEMIDAGFDVEHYRGRNFYEGPAVRVDHFAEIQAVVRATDLTVRWDNLGLGFIVYLGGV